MAYEAFDDIVYALVVESETSGWVCVWSLSTRVGGS